jgi:hypothetical protein
MVYKEMDWSDSDEEQQPEEAKPQFNHVETQTLLSRQPITCGYCGRNLHLHEQIITVSCNDGFCRNCFELLKSIPGRPPQCPLCLATVQEWIPK